MGQLTGVRAEITTSLDGFVAGPNQTLEDPLGAGGERLHEWVVGLASLRDQHGLEGGVVNDDAVVAESVRSPAPMSWAGACSAAAKARGRTIRNADALVGRRATVRRAGVRPHPPPARDVLKKDGTVFTFVTDGIESALDQARAAAGDRDVTVAGGADVIQQVLRAGLLDELQIHLAPVLLGGGVRLFDEATRSELEPVAVIESPAVTHLTYRVKK